MADKNKYEVNCLDEFNKKRIVIILANNKVEAKEQVLTNHPKYEVISILSQDELKAVKSLTR